MLFMKMANFLYQNILKNGPFTPMTYVPAISVGDEVVLTDYVLREPSQLTDFEKDKVSPDIGVQLILNKYLTNVMCNNII